MKKSITRKNSSYDYCHVKIKKKNSKKTKLERTKAAKNKKDIRKKPRKKLKNQTNFRNNKDI